MSDNTIHLPGLDVNAGMYERDPAFRAACDEESRRIVQTHWRETTIPGQLTPPVDGMPTNGVRISIGGRVVQWELTEDQTAILAQSLVQALGPAKES